MKNIWKIMYIITHDKLDGTFSLLFSAVVLF